MNEEERRMQEQVAVEQAQTEALELKLQDVINAHVQRISVKRDMLEAETLIDAATQILNLTQARYPLPALKLDYHTILTMLEEALDRVRGAAELMAQGVDLTAKLPDDLQSQVDDGLIHLHEAFNILRRRK